MGILFSAWWTGDGIVIDESQMTETTARLKEVEPVLDSLPTYEGTKRPEAASLEPCYLDPSGDYLIQPHASRSWTLRRADQSKLTRLAQAISNDLSNHGWAVTRDADNAAIWRITFDSGNGWTGTGEIFPNYSTESWEAFQQGGPHPDAETAITVSLSVDGANPCRDSLWG